MREPAQFIARVRHAGPETRIVAVALDCLRQLPDRARSIALLILGFTLLRLLLDSATMRIWTPNTALHSLRWTGDFWLLRYVNQQEHLPRPLRSR